MNSRRDFIKTAATVAVGTGLASHIIPGAHAAGSDAIRVGVIGCGGRGTGAVQNALASSDGVTVVAMGDAFQDRLDESLKKIKDGKFGGSVNVPKERQFVGFDAFEKVIATDANYIILATPPGFRPQHLKAAIGAGKHVFTEKPVAVDGPGIREVLALVAVAKQKKLGVGAGLQRRHQTGYLEAMKRIHDGAIGDITAGRAYWNQGPLWNKPREANWTDMEYQLRNWLYYTWLSGDHIVEQHVHNIDVINWVMKTHPVRAMGMGGRQVRTGAEFGHIYDHFAIDYEYANGAHMMSQCRQIAGCANYVHEAVHGTNGRAELENTGKYSIEGKNAWKFAGKDTDPYVQEHTDLIASIRSGNPYVELQNVAESTLTAIMGRMSAYSGKAVTWEQALNSQETLAPAPKITLGPAPFPKVAMPGVTPLT
jgi:myo-inositol 2-dehydrogenase / D-chiro-inositol 1-dehydrogenase